MRETTDSDYFQPEYFHYFYDYLKHTIGNKRIRKMEIDTMPSELTFSIDLFGNINVQIEEIKSTIRLATKNLKDEKIIVDRDFMPTTYLFYLRFHDAVKNRVLYKNIAKKLKNIEDYDLTAKSLMTEYRQKKDELIRTGYREIAMIPNDWLEKTIIVFPSDC